METVEAIRRDHRIAFAPVETRRNLLTRGVPLNHQVGRSFRVGETVLFGERLNVPCKYIEGSCSESWSIRRCSIAPGLTAALSAVA